MMLKFMKTDIVGTKEGKDLVDVKCDAADNWLPVKSVDVGAGTTKALAAIDKDDKRKKIHYSFRQCLVKTVSYLQIKLRLLSNPVQRNMQCLHPLVRNQMKANRRLLDCVCIFRRSQRLMHSVTNCRLNG
jgi:hypothetical protein